LEVPGQVDLMSIAVIGLYVSYQINKSALLVLVLILASHSCIIGTKVYQGHLAICSQPTFLWDMGAITTNGDYTMVLAIIARNAGVPYKVLCAPAKNCLLYTKLLVVVYGVHNFCSQCDLWLQFLYPQAVRLIHNFKIVTNNGHILYNVYKNGSIYLSSSRVSMEEIVAKDGSKIYIIVHKIPWLQKCMHFDCLATFLVTFTNCGHNSSLNSHGHTQMHTIPMYTPA